MAPKRSRRFLKALQDQWQRGVKEREQKVTGEGCGKIFVGEIHLRPGPEKDERRDSHRRSHGRQSAGHQGQPNQPEIGEEEVPAQQHRPMSQRSEREKIKRSHQRGASDRERRVLRRMIGFAAALRQPGRREKERLQAGQHRHRDQHLVPAEILARLEVQNDPGPLGDHRADRSQCRQHLPTLPMRDGKQPGVQQRDIAEEPQRVVPRGKQHRRQKSACDAQHCHHGRIHANRQKKRRASDKRHDDKVGTVLKNGKW